MRKHAPRFQVPPSLQPQRAAHLRMSCRTTSGVASERRILPSALTAASASYFVVYLDQPSRTGFGTAATAAAPSAPSSTEAWIVVARLKA